MKRPHIYHEDEAPKITLGSLIRTFSFKALYQAKDTKQIAEFEYKAPSDPINTANKPCYVLVCLGVVNDVNAITDDIVQERMTQLGFWRADRVRDEIASICETSTADEALRRIKETWKVQ